MAPAQDQEYTGKLHRFLSEQKRRELWEQKIKRKKWMPTDFSLLCEGARGCTTATCPLVPADSSDDDSRRRRPLDVTPHGETKVRPVCTFKWQLWSPLSRRVLLDGEDSKTGIMATDSSACNYSHSVIFFYDLVGKNVSVDWNMRDFVVIGVGLTVCLIVVLANLMVMIAIFINHRFHFPIYYLLANMAAADLFAGIAYTNLMLNTGPWTRTLTKTQWYIRGALIDISLTASVANLLAVAVERHQTIMTMQLHSTMTKRRVVLLIICIWASGIIMGLVPSTFWNCECDFDDCSTVAPLYSRRFLIFWAVFNLLIFFIMVAMYTRIFIYVKYQSRYTSQHTSEMRHNQTIVNLMKTISMVLGAFVLCWTPGLVTLLLDGLLGKESHANRYEKFCLFIAECNSLVNPIIYSLRDNEMRKTFKRILCCLCQRGVDQQEPSTHFQIDSPLPDETAGCVGKSEDQALFKPRDTNSKDDSWSVPEV
ncbi:lysophosphatidic acid receptor 2a isoform X2 [Mugil cephalus]|uniref:lysophosphatidic acid receptor 2a isoform X2 n=1 Tax=Mugil cephalus TaxID=48193 RepID=UPI001FB7E704|nr:lysophosphatidic acid receptor 2a isoform X2 [Mugil cephalus]